LSQRNSGYDRIEFDEYPTPAWVTEAVIPYIPPHIRSVWEPAAGEGKMADVLTDNGFDVASSDIQTGNDFFSKRICIVDAIITNPPYSLAQEFIEHALDLVRDQQGLVAMILRCDFDHAKTRRNLFSDNKAFTRKLILTRRIRWIEGSTGSPSFNHAWYVWDWRNMKDPTISYHFGGTK
jgi:hypothetical protein